MDKAWEEKRNLEVHNSDTLDEIEKTLGDINHNLARIARALEANNTGNGIIAK